MSRHPVGRAPLPHRRGGFALTELLVAVGIGALILTALIWLQVDYVGWARRAMNLGQPAPSAQGLAASARAFDRCAYPDATLTESDGAVQARIGEALTPVLAVPPDASAEVRVAARPDGSLRPGRSMAAVHREGATIAVVAQRCDLPEVCRYDPDKGACGG